MTLVEKLTFFLELWSYFVTTIKKKSTKSFSENQLTYNRKRLQFLAFFDLSSKFNATVSTGLYCCGVNLTLLTNFYFKCKNSVLKKILSVSKKFFLSHLYINWLEWQSLLQVPRLLKNQPLKNSIKALYFGSVETFIPPSSTAQPMDYHITNERKLLVGSQYFALSLLTQFFAYEMN